MSVRYEIQLRDALELRTELEKSIRAIDLLITSGEKTIAENELDSELRRAELLKNFKGTIH